MENVSLRQFTPDQIIYDDDEIRDILEFFFPSLTSQIKAFEMTDHVREFAQGLLLEAIDASYALGWVKIIAGIFEGIYYKEPTTTIKKIVKKLAKKAANHWFKHIRQGTNLSHIQIYEVVRLQIYRHFSFKMNAYLDDGISKNNKGTANALIDYASKTTLPKIIWNC